MAGRTIKCPNCPRRFADNAAVFSHIKAKHNGKGIAPFRPENQPDHEPSYASRLIDARLDRAMGLPVDDDLAEALDMEDGR